MICLWSRIWDLHNMDAVLRHMTAGGQRELISRLGYLNVINPLKPALDYCINTRYVDERCINPNPNNPNTPNPNLNPNPNPNPRYFDERCMLVLLLQIAPSEVSDQIRYGSFHVKLACRLNAVSLS